MDSTPKQGLSGKARRSRDMSRSHRMYSQQLIEEYLDWESGEEEPERFIPIKRASEFLPSVEVPTTSSPDDSGAGQFEFDHTKQEPIVDRSAAPTREARVDNPQPAEPTVEPAVLPQLEPVVSVVEKPSVIRPRRARINVLAEIAPAPTLSTQGFLIGCGIGGAAAMVLLILAGWLVG